jgi:hypothetical protein
MSELFVIFAPIFLKILKLAECMKSFFFNFKHIHFATPWDSAVWGGRTTHTTVAAPI